MTRLTFPHPPVVEMSTAEAISEGARLSRMAKRDISPSDVARVLLAAKVRFVLVGAHAVNAYSGRPRATVDVDVLTDSVAKAQKALRAAFPDLHVRDTPVVVRFMDAEHEAIDVMKAATSKLFRRIVRSSVSTTIDGVEIPLPSPEGVLAMKFASMIFPGRKPADRFQDAADFMRVLEAKDPVSDAMLRELGELVYAGGGNEILAHVANARAGRSLQI